MYTYISTPISRQKSEKMAKRKLDMDSTVASITGYLHDISTVTTSANGKTRYFTGSFQSSKSDFKRLVCFHADKHEKYVSAATITSPVKITGQTMSPGRNNTIEIICNKQTSMEIVMEDLPFKKQKLSHTNKIAEAKNLTDLNSENQTGTIYVKLIKFLGQKREVNTKYGVKTTRNAVIADNTDSKKITIWQDLIQLVQDDHYYKMTDIATNMYNYEVWINTTAKTKITEIEEYGDVVENSDLLKKDDKTITIAQISVHANTRCSNVKCNKPIKLETQDPTVRCNSCKMKQKVMNMKSTVTAVMNTQDHETYILYQDQLTEFLQTQSQQDLIKDIDRLEDFMLEIEKFQIQTEHKSNVITNIEHC